MFSRRQTTSADNVILRAVNSNADLELVVVLDTNDPYALALAEGCLREAGIPFFELNQVTTLVNDVDPFMRKWRRIQVARDREAEAREIVEGVMHPGPIPSDAFES